MHYLLSISSLSSGSIFSSAASVLNRMRWSNCQLHSVFHFVILFKCSDHILSISPNKWNRNVRVHKTEAYMHTPEYQLQDPADVGLTPGSLTCSKLNESNNVVKRIHFEDGTLNLVMEILSLFLLGSDSSAIHCMESKHPSCLILSWITTSAYIWDPVGTC